MNYLDAYYKLRDCANNLNMSPDALLGAIEIQSRSSHGSLVFRGQVAENKFVEHLRNSKYSSNFVINNCSEYNESGDFIITIRDKQNNIISNIKIVCEVKTGKFKKLKKYSTISAGFKRTRKKPPNNYYDQNEFDIAVIVTQVGLDEYKILACETSKMKCSQLYSNKLQPSQTVKVDQSYNDFDNLWKDPIYVIFDVLFKQLNN